LPFIPFKVNTAVPKKNSIWSEMYHYFMYNREEFLAHYHQRSNVEVCQTHPIKMTWCPLRLFRQTTRSLRGGCQREHEMDVYRFSRHDDVADQTLGNGLTFFKRELGKILAQQLAKGRGIVHDVLPMDTLWPCVSEVLACLGNLVQLRSAFLPPCLSLRQIENLGLIGVE
jgi:hypothetical protein